MNKSFLDNGYMQHPGWSQTVGNRPNYETLWTPDRLGMLQQKITQLLEGVSEDGRPILVPITAIGHVISQVYQSHRPQVGSIYSRYIQMDPEGQRNDIRDIEDRSINIIVSQIRNEMMTIQNNKRLTIWNTVYGDFNKEGLRAHSGIKIRKKRPNVSMGIGMRY
ncbi:hypothetical protein OAV62_01625 [bacterium]|nr:hypothetical protein [bacterium]